MKILFKLILFPLWIVVALLQSFGVFFRLISTMVLGSLIGILSFCAFLEFCHGEGKEVLETLAMAFIIFLFMLLYDWLLELITEFRYILGEKLLS